jgi:hypothetical protein
MKNYDMLYFNSGSNKILSHFGVNKIFLQKTDTDTERTVRYFAKNLDNDNGLAFLTAITNMVLYKLCVLKRKSLSPDDELLLALFGKTLAKKDVRAMTIEQVKVLAEDFGRHLFWDITEDKSSRNWVPHKTNIPVGLLKLVGYTSLNLEDEKNEG